MKREFNDRQRKIYNDYSPLSNESLLKIIDNRAKYLSEVVDIVTHILIERNIIPNPNVNIVESDESSTEFENSKNNDIQKPKSIEKFFSTEGRIGRDKYFLRSSLLLIISVLLTYLKQHYPGDETWNTFLYLPVLLFYILSLIQGAKRFHDLDSGGLNILWCIIPLVYFILWFYLIYKKGTDGQNKYGPQPLQSKNFVS
jgi:uncharacterized membrane protein YhaH (DUF805 family)